MNSRTTSLQGNLLRVGAIGLGLAAAGALVVQGSEAAFTASTVNEANIAASGTVSLSDDDENTTMFKVSGLNGGQTVTRCINVKYTGSLGAEVRLHTTVSGELAPGLATEVKVGTGATGGTSFSCDGFVPGTTSFTGTLAALGTTHNSYATGLGGFNDAVNNASRSYMVTMVVSNENTFQGKSAGVGFTWEAQGKDAATTNVP